MVRIELALMAVLVLTLALLSTHSKAEDVEIAGEPKPPTDGGVEVVGEPKPPTDGGVEVAGEPKPAGEAEPTTSTSGGVELESEDDDDDEFELSTEHPYLCKATSCNDPKGCPAFNLYLGRHEYD